jgi:hypothetical protein
VKRALVVLGVIALLAVALVVYVSGSSGLPDRPVPIAWDREACAHCHMHIGEPRHAAQLVTTQGEVASFDDPGCAIRWVAEHRPALHRFWFHGEGDTWIPAAKVAFVSTPTTPMGSGLLAVELGTPGARPLAEVQGDLR